MGSEVSFGGYEGKSLVEKIRDKLDRAYRDWLAMDPKVEHGRHEPMLARAWGRIEGVASALGILRSTSTKHEIEEAKERCQTNIP